MGIIKEPLNIDFVVESRLLTKVKEKAISDFIIKDKEKRSIKKSSNKIAIKQKRTQLA
jgi:hypothetical protein